MSNRRPPRASLSGPAYYSQPRFLQRTAAREWWTLLHPPYTLWHLSYVVIGACLVGPVSPARLLATLGAFLLAVGLGAHALDELHGRPLGTSIASWQLVVAAAASLTGAVGLGVVGMFVVNAYLGLFIVLGVVVALAYNLELANGLFHTDLVFALGWGALPLLTGYFAQHGQLGVPSLIGALGAALLSRTQRLLSAPARQLRRRVESVEGLVRHTDGSVVPIEKVTLLAPLERALKSLGWAVVAISAAMACAQFHLW